MIYRKDENSIFEAYVSILNKNRRKQTLLKEQKEIEYDSIDEELFKKADLIINRAKFALENKFPFYWRILEALQTVLSYEVDSMAVDALGNIYINPYFVTETLDQDGVIAVLVHECGHILGLHFFSKGEKDHRLWNVATDYIINRDLLEDGFKLPDGPDFKALLPIKSSNDKWIIPKYDNVDITEFTDVKMYTFIKKWQEKNPEDVEEDIKISEDFDRPIYPDDPEDVEDKEIQIGNIVRDTENDQYGRVTAINKSTGEIEMEPLTKDEVSEYFKKTSPRNL